MTAGAGAGLELVAPAKLNLALEVLGPRGDGYHEIDTVLTTIDLCDQVRLRPRPRGAGLSVAVSGPHASGIDSGSELAGAAARALAEASGRQPDLHIEVEKRVPHPAGLGGASSDAAAVLRGLDALWELGWDGERLAALAASLGSDVPFFLAGGAARAAGRGERIEPLPDLRPLSMLVLVPPVPEAPGKTARRYAALTARDYSGGERSRRLAHRLARRAPPPAGDLVNAFEAAVERSEPELVAHYAAYRAAGAPTLHLCGAGPAVYVLVHERAKRAELAEAFRARGALVIPARTLGRDAARAARELPPPGAAGGG
ncbi:MAG: 4-(cytidine 5'-diphospho)-2-C-methyl-D-erythritol kinase [Chloroflexi bacterium]|nr:4-(cytidine 5'-diphospho)-2-C-methyl-D-erythritol kinase [Chloroflexota bacterium]